MPCRALAGSPLGCSSSSVPAWIIAAGLSALVPAAGRFLLSRQVTCEADMGLKQEDKGENES
jgi:hypothetical protein